MLLIAIENHVFDTLIIIPHMPDDENTLKIEDSSEECIVNNVFSYN
jgi:hypothetical protein